MSTDDTFDLVVFPPVRPPSLSLSNSNKARQGPLSQSDFLSVFDTDGRLVEEHKFRQLIFRGGLQPSVRREAWHFLFGLYPFHSTRIEREVLLADRYCKYKALKKRWKSILAENEETRQLLQPAYLDTSDGEVGSVAMEMQDNVPLPLLPSPDVQQQLKFMDFEAQVYAGRCPFNLAVCKTAIHIIDKDVPRTDRDLEYFQFDAVAHLQMLREVLITYAAFHPDVNYTQGMNDILSRFIVVFDSEVEAYWCFVNYIEQMKSELVESGILHRLSIVRELLSELDQDLFDYLKQLGIDDMTFCHRWMLLLFKREFPWEEGLRCFEIISSHYLEVSSIEAEKIRYEEHRLGFQNIGGKNRLEDGPINSNYTFDIFLCVTILIEQRENIFRSSDTADVVQLICSLCMNMQLNDLLTKAETLFERYCRKSVIDCFHILDYPSPVSPTQDTESL